MKGTAWLGIALLPALAGCAGEPPRAERTGEAAARMTWMPQQQLTATGTTSGRFGWSVAVSGDTAISGVPDHAGELGGAYFFVRSGATWTEQDVVVPSDGSGIVHFGWSVSLSADTAIVGAPDDASSTGAAYVLVRSGDTWATETKLLASDGVGGDELGWSVAVDGDTAIVGALEALAQQGAAYVFVRSGGAWSLQQKLTPSDMPVDPGVFGSSVALDGDTAIVGAPSVGGSNPGAAYVFVRSGTVWSEQQKLVSTISVPGDRFGSSVAIDADTALVGAQYAGGGMGEAFAFVRSGAAWTQLQQLPTDPSLGEVGDSVAIRGDSAIVGGSGTQFVPGGVQTYTRSGGSFAPDQVLALPGGMPGDWFGWSVAMDQRTLVVGEPGLMKGIGAASVFYFASTNGEACASGDDCASGFCVDGVCCVVPACPGEGTCNAAEHCQPVTGKCSVTPMNEGASCDDHDACTHGDTCQGGHCTGAPTLCPPSDECHEFGACDPATGVCATPEKPDGQPCSTGACKAGVCEGSGSPDAGSDGGAGGDRSGSSSGGGCGCDASGSPAGGALTAGLAALLLVQRRRRR